MKGRGETVKVADLKPGDGVTAAGNLDAPNKTLHAAIVFVVDAAQLKAMKDNLGKTYIVGKVTSIDLDNAKMTVERPDHVSQTIGFDEGTSFRRGRVNMGGMGGGMYGGGGRPGGGAGRTAPNGPPQGESITLADIKVGDEVGGRGEMKNGVFVPAELSVATPGQRRRRPEGGPGVGGDAPGTPGAPSEPNPPAR
jgi:predicted RNA-binding protein